MITLEQLIGQARVKRANFIRNNENTPHFPIVILFLDFFVALFKLEVFPKRDAFTMLSRRFKEQFLLRQFFTQSHQRSYFRYFFVKSRSLMIKTLKTKFRQSSKFQKFRKLPKNLIQIQSSQIFLQMNFSARESLMMLEVFFQPSSPT
jgi:hypothetical protein